MTVKEKLYKLLYPMVMKFNRYTTKGTCIYNADQIKPIDSIYELSVELNTGDKVAISKFKGKKILLINTASECGFTRQFEDLQKLHNDNNVVIIGFPSSEFMNQEKTTDQEIATFCQINYGVTFPMSKKTSVLIKNNQEAIYKWLTQPSLNGWNNHQPDWNFSKYLINETGMLTHYFGPSFSPLGNEIQLALKS